MNAAGTAALAALEGLIAAARERAKILCQDGIGGGPEAAPLDWESPQGQRALAYVTAGCIGMYQEQLEASPARLSPPPWDVTP